MMKPLCTALPYAPRDLTLPLVWYRDFGPYAQSVRLVRRQVGHVLSRWGCSEDDMATVGLICSELATNAVEHAHVPDMSFAVRITITQRDCLIEVSDELSAPPKLADPDEDDERGRGLRLVVALADDFGHRRTPDGGKTVWARCALEMPGFTSY